MTRLPIGFQSLLIQCLALLCVALLAALFHFTFLAFPAVWQLMLVQGAIAATLSRAWRQPVWWPPLHLLFFPTVFLARQLNWPAWIYLAAFLLLVAFYWSAFRTRVPLYLSDRKAWRALIPLLPASSSFRFIDLGSGLGDVPLHLESHFPQGDFFGTEIAPAPWLISRLRAWLRHSRVRFLRRDYGALDLAEFDVVFAFLSPAAMPALWQQAHAQMRPGTVFISLSFGVDTQPPDHVVPLADGARHTLYAWHMQGGGSK